MLIRLTTQDDLRQWIHAGNTLFPPQHHLEKTESDPFFLRMAATAIANDEALTAADYRSGAAMGFLCFSRRDNQILWLGVRAADRRRGIGRRLMTTALRQLSDTRPVTIHARWNHFAPGTAARGFLDAVGFQESDNDAPCQTMRLTLSEKRGGSFHYRYPAFRAASDSVNCPVCQGLPAPVGHVLIDAWDNARIYGEYPGQARLFGKLYVMPCKHFTHFEEMPTADAEALTHVLQKTGRALRRVTGAIKINYELHANTGAHLHVHLFPRFLDDDFPSAPIDYRQTEPAPYEDMAEFDWFIQAMRQALREDTAKR